MFWEVKLKGDKGDLSVLAEILCGKEISICKKEEGFFCRISITDNNTNYKEVKNVFQETINNLTAFVKIQWGGRLISIDGSLDQVLPDGRRISSIEIGTAKYEYRVYPPRVGHYDEDGNLVYTYPDDLLNKFLRVYKLSDNLRFSLKIRSIEPLSYSDLYRIWELVKVEFGGKKAEANLKKWEWATHNEINRFRYSANSPNVLGEESRHSVPQIRKGKKGKETPEPMYFDEACRFIDRLLSNWINSLDNNQ